MWGYCHRIRKHKFALSVLSHVASSRIQSHTVFSTLVLYKQTSLQQGLKSWKVGGKESKLIHQHEGNRILKKGGKSQTTFRVKHWEH